MFGGGFPFSGFPGMGGDDEGMRRPKKDVDTSKYYDLLGVSKDASDSEIKKAFRKAAMKNHPDKGGDPDKFKEINTAYEVLSNSEKRKLYDMGGEEAVSGNGGGGGGGADIFDLFGFGGGGRRDRGPRKGEDVVHPLKVKLEDLYNGKSTKLAMRRHTICSDCNGSGSNNPGAEVDCRVCNGSGVKMVVRQIGPGMIQQMQTTCPNCKGTGQSISEEDKCKKCKGKKTVQERKILEVHVDKGMKHGQKITFRGAADEEPGVEPGDVVVVLQQEKHNRFLRKGNDLLTEREISLCEALCGCEFYLEHLDKRALHVKTQPGEVLQPDAVRSIPDEGMPTHKRIYDKGGLYIRFKVKFPETGSLDANSLDLLKKALPAPRPLGPAPGEVEEAHLHDVGKFGEGQEGASREAYGDDDDEDDEHHHGGGQRVQCAQQ